MMTKINSPDPTPAMLRIAANLRSLCHRSRLSQQDVADVVGVSKQMVGRWTQCTSTPDAIQAAELAKLFRVPLDVFVCEDVSAIRDSDLEEIRDVARLIKRWGYEKTHSRLLGAQETVGEGKANVQRADDEKPARPRRKAT